MRVTSLKTPSGKALEFVDGVESAPPRLIMGVFGVYGGGKSRFPVTAPDISAIIPTDRKTRRTVEKTLAELKEQGIVKRVLMPKEDFVRSINPMTLATMDEATSMAYYRAHVDRIKEAAWALHAHKDVNCVTIDLFSQFYQDVCWALYGRTGNKVKKIGEKTIQDRTDANQEVIDFINSLSSKHLILTCKSKEEYSRNARTGRDTWEGFKFMGNHTNLILELEVNSKWKPDGQEDEDSWRFGMNVRASQDRIDIPQDTRVLTDEQITFENLATFLYPEYEWSEGGGK